ncbi:phosphatidate cytidylyltransferase [Candidatus Pelagibacter sp. HIMB109]|uniref:phosphatidate cytidylyltransferase n=1 Tax=Candidatus Pelagibacter sp. HIMB109 TaxID=3415412 RepID=UPI003F862143
MNSNFKQRTLFSITFAPIVLLAIFFGNIYFNILLFIIMIIGLYEIRKLKNLNTKIIISLLFCYFLYSCLILNNHSNGKHLIFLLLIITWLSDVGGYMFGKFFGGKKIGYISPNKTYTGIFGSILFSQFSQIYIYYFNLFSNENNFYKFIFVFISCFFVIIGDLVFSYIKRLNKIKDYSNMLKGHGGLFDRIDGLIFLTIIFNIYFT